MALPCIHALTWLRVLCLLCAAIPFISNKNGRFAVEPAAKETLAGIKGRVAIVVVAGPYRTGKSYLLNKLVNAQKGFNVGNTVKACTKGIWLWGQPIKRDDCTYVFLDSEGLGSLEQEQTFDTQIFSLSLLLSTLFVLNTQGTINESALEQVRLARMYLLALISCLGVPACLTNCFLFSLPLAGTGC